MKTTEVFETYWHFAAERSIMFHNKIKGVYPLTLDPILMEYKFTNVYRAADRVSQYLIKEVIYKGDQDPKEILFRILLFKIFNKIETWEALTEDLGIPIAWRHFSFNDYNFALQRIMDKVPIYSAAYIMASPSQFGYDRKHSNHLALLLEIFQNGFADKVQNCKSLKELYNLLLEIPSFGNFLAYQFAIDINYSEVVDFDENEFIVPGPGALSGIHKCFSDLGGKTPSQIIEWMTENQNKFFDKYDLNFMDLFGRSLKLIDIQNIFCETNKYTRIYDPKILGIDGRSKIKQKYLENNLKPIQYFFPPKWGINDLVPKTVIKKKGLFL